jgi:hypothetical protein
VARREVAVAREDPADVAPHRHHGAGQRERAGFGAVGAKGGERDLTRSSRRRSRRSGRRGSGGRCHRRSRHEAHVVAARRAEFVGRRVDVSALRARDGCSGRGCSGRCGGRDGTWDRSRWSRDCGRSLRDGDRHRRGRAHAVRRRLRRESLRRSVARKLSPAAQTKLVVVLVLFRALGTGDHRGSSSNERLDGTSSVAGCSSPN